MRLVWKKNRGKSGCVIYKKQPMMMMMMMMICNTRQSNRCGEGMTKTMDCYYYYYYWARGDRAFGDVFSLCRVMIVTTQQIINIFYIISMDGRHSMRTHTTTNQKQRAAIMEDSKERWHYHQGCERPSFGDNIVGSSGNICWAGRGGRMTRARHSWGGT